jgi:GGDEF domain-containing protein
MNARYNGRIVGVIILFLDIPVVPEHGETADTLLRAADQALSRAKPEGGDRVVVTS